MEISKLSRTLALLFLWFNARESPLLTHEKCPSWATINHIHGSPTPLLTWPVVSTYLCPGHKLGMCVAYHQPSHRIPSNKKSHILTLFDTYFRKNKLLLDCIKSLYSFAFLKVVYPNMVTCDVERVSFDDYLLAAPRE